MQTLYELDALSHAKNYQQWMYHSVQPFLGKRILELGSGIGNLSVWLPVNELLVLSDVDHSFIDHLNLIPKLKSEKIKIIQLDLAQTIMSQVEQYDLDTIVSFNVMEHIEDDYASLVEQVNLLKSSKSNEKKRIVIFAPAFQFAFGELDRVFKHYRRYSAGDLKRKFNHIDPKIKVTTRYFNLLSFLPWIIQGRLLKKNKITPEQVGKIERVIPFWKPIDQLLTKSMKIPFGQSVICIAEIES